MSLLFTVQEWHSTVPTIPLMRLMPAASNLGEVYFSSGLWMLALYLLFSNSAGVNAVVFVVLDGHI